MPQLDASTAEVLVYSFKDGLLAKLAHDLKMRVSSFTIDIADDQSSVTARFDPSSLEVVCARKDGRDDTGTLSAGDKKKIYKNITQDVLRTKKHGGDITFRSTSIEGEGDARTITGDLTLHGQTRSVTARVRAEGDSWVTSVTLHQPDFGIRPFKALGGALKVQADVRVDVRAPKG